MTDPDRVPDPVKTASTLPYGTAIIYRHFGADNKDHIAGKLRQVTLARRQQLLIGDDPALAIRAGADGVHFRRDKHIKAPTIWRKRCPDWIITMAGLKDSVTYLGNLNGLDAMFISSIFESQSPSAGQPIGISGLKATCAALSVPIIALGGISTQTAPLLLSTSASGLACISGGLDFGLG